MKEFVTLRPEMYRQLKDDGCDKKKAKSKKKSRTKGELKFEDYQNCQGKNETTLKSQQRLSSKAHNAFTQKISKIALSVMMLKDYKTPDGVAIYPNGYACWNSI